MNVRLMRLVAAAVICFSVCVVGFAAASDCRPGLAGPFSYDYGIQLRVGVALADFNGDGRTDIVSLHRFVDVSQTGKVAAILLNRGNNSFETLPLTLSTGLDFSTVASFDVDRDGKADLVLGGTSPLTVLLGNGDGTFRAGSTVNVRNVVAVTSGDFNEDGNRDLAVVQTDPPALTLLLGDGKGGFTAGNSYTIKTNATSVLVADFDGDGHADVITADGSAVDAFFGNGNGTLAAASVVAPFGATALAAGDVTGDGRPELFVAFGGTVTVYRYAATRAFQNDASYNVGRSASTLTLADADGDGILDMFAVGSGVTIVKGLGNAKFGTVTSFAGGSNTKYGAVGDVTGDGRPDAVVANNDSTDISVLQNDGKGQLIAMRLFEISPTAGPAIVAAADINDDAKSDIIIGTQGSGDLWFYTGHGDGTFNAPTGFTVGAGTKAIRFGDFNGDKVMDMVVLAADGKSATAFRGLGGGRFGNPYGIGFSGPVCCIDTGDLNNDGLTDVVFALDGGGVGVVLATNTGFNAPVIYPSPMNPTSIVAADFDQDKSVDVAVANSNGDNITVFRGSTSGALFAPVSVPGNKVTSMTSALIGQTMVLATAGKRVEVFWGDSPLRFGRVDSYGTVGLGVGIVAGDLNGDAKPDLIVTNYEQITGQNFVTWLINDGTGTFNAQPSVPAEIVTGSMAAADFDGSGRTDVIMGGLGKAMLAMSRCEPARVTMFAKMLGQVPGGQSVQLTATALTNIPNAVVFLFKEGDKIIGSAIADQTKNPGIGTTTINLSNGLHSVVVQVQFTDGTTGVSDPMSLLIGTTTNKRRAAGK